MVLKYQRLPIKYGERLLAILHTRRNIWEDYKGMAAKRRLIKVNHCKMLHALKQLVACKN